MISKASIAKASKVRRNRAHVACQTSINNSHRWQRLPMPSVPASGSMRVRRGCIFMHGLFGTKLQARDSTPFERGISACWGFWNTCSVTSKVSKTEIIAGKTFEKVLGVFQIERSSHLRVPSDHCLHSVWTHDLGISNNIPILFTDSVSSIAEDKVLNRVSSTHRDGRALDVSTRDGSRLHRCRPSNS